MFINGYQVPVHPDGGFLAFIPVYPDDFTFELSAYSRKEIQKAPYDIPTAIATASVTVRIPKPLEQIPDDSLAIAGDFRPPLGDLVLTAGERLDVSFLGTPGLNAWCSIAGLVDSIPMAETPPRQQAYWGESVFGAGAVPDSLKIRGIYSGSYTIPPEVRVRNAKIIYHLAPPPAHEALLQALYDTSATHREILRSYVTMPDSISRQASYLVTTNSPDYPFTVRFTDSVQILRYGPLKGYFTIFQPAGVEALAVGAMGNWYKLKLSNYQYAWANSASVECEPRGILPPRSYVSSLRTYSFPDSLTVEIPLSGKHPFRVIEDDRRTLRIQLFGVTTNTDWIRYDFTDPLIDIATWSQPETGVHELRLQLTQDIWGYDTHYLGNSFYFVLNKPPEETWRLKGKTIVLDPGHSPDPGSVGPTGYREADANLSIALVLRQMLKAAGANVVMTRDDSSDLPLYDRPVIAKDSDADLFVSIHNNALPDGVNPFTNNGVSTYYYHPHSINLAKAIQSEMVKATGLPDHGLYYGNLAVDRPTQYPAVLVECAFMIVPEQEAMLKTYRFRKTVAGAIMRGIEHFLEEYNDGR